MNESDSEILAKLDSVKWESVGDCWHFSNGYGQLCGWVEPSKHNSFLAYQGMELRGDFTDTESAMKAVEHAHKDPRGFGTPYPT